MANKILTLSTLATYDELIKSLISTQTSTVYTWAQNYTDETLAEEAGEIPSASIQALFTE